MSAILGFDPSLVSSGYAFYDLGDGEYHTGVIKTNKMRGSERIQYIKESFWELVAYVQTDLIVYEGYSMGSRGNTFDIGELGGVLKLLAWEKGLDVLLVPPSNLKQFTTGKGNAKKPQMIEAIANIWGYSITQDDEADAFALLKMGEAYLSKRKPRAAYRAKSLASCTLINGKK